MDWFSPEFKQPEAAKRLLVETAEGSLLFARLVRHGNGWHWIDDQSLPIRSAVIRWAVPVSGSETQ